MTNDLASGPVCPVPLSHSDQIILGHGSGGQLTHQLIEQVFHPYLRSSFLDDGDDSASIPLDPAAGRIALTTRFASGDAPVLPGRGYWPTLDLRYGE